MEAFQVNHPGSSCLKRSMPRWGASVAARMPRTNGTSPWRAMLGPKGRAGRALIQGKAHACCSWKSYRQIGSCASKRWQSARPRTCVHARFVGVVPHGDEGGGGVQVRAAAGAVSEVEEVRELGWDQGFAEKYEMSEELLGEGSFGRVWGATEKSTGQSVAVKVLPKNRGDDWEKYSALLRNEVHCWEAMEDCKEVVKLYGYYEDDTSLYIVQERCTGGDLQHYLKEYGKMSECEASQAIAAVLRMLSESHEKGICFGDVKPANFMLKASYPCKRHLVDSEAPKGILMLKAIDFGCSQILAEDTKLKKRTGTPLYMAPDLFFGWYGVEVDVWAAGMLMYQLISGKLPFFGDNVDKLAKASPMKIFQAFMDSELEFEGQEWDSISSNAKDLITQMLDMEASARISAKDALQHPWILEHAECKESVEVASSNILKFPGAPGASLGKGTNDVRGKDGKGGAI